MVTGSPVVLLSSSSGNLTFTYDQDGVGGWCQVHLLMSGVSHALGAERLKYIVTHLSLFLGNSATGVRWVLSLSERHTSAYGEHIGEDVSLYLHDADAALIARLTLTGAEKRRWLQILLRHAQR